MAAEHTHEVVPALPALLFVASVAARAIQECSQEASEWEHSPVCQWRVVPAPLDAASKLNQAPGGSAPAPPHGVYADCSPHGAGERAPSERDVSPAATAESGDTACAAAPRDARCLTSIPTRGRRARSELARRAARCYRKEGEPQPALSGRDARRHCGLCVRE